MDPSGIIGIIGVAGHIITMCTKLSLDWRHAPDDAKKLKSEVESLHKTLLETYNHMIRDPDFISAFDSSHSAVLSDLAAPSSSDDSALLFTCKQELEDVLKALQKRLDGSRFGRERLKATVFGERTQSAIENLQRRCQVINSMILIDNTTLAVNTNLEVRNTKKHLEERHLDEKKRTILDWITPIDFAAQQIDNLERRQEGTGQSFLDSPEFQTWVEEDGKTLFCPGMPGAGKTMLFSIVIEHLQDQFGQDSAVGIAYLFCNFRRHDEQKPRELLASILKQLYWALPAGPNDVQKAYDKHDSPNGHTPMSTPEVMACLRSVTSCFDKVYILLDALDECRGDEGYRDTLLTTVLGLNNTANVNCFATSRYIPEVESYFDNAPSVEIRATDEDVIKFLGGHMHKLPRVVTKSKELQDEIKQSIVQAVQGMFLLAKLHLDSLQGKRSAKHIRETLAKLASGSSAYDVAYGEAMERIEGQLADQEVLAKDALSWIVCATRPLKTWELQHALAVERDTTELDEDNLTELEDIVSVCAGLVTIDEESEIIRLVHYTTQEFFERTAKWWLPGAQHLIVESCITYLSFEVFGSGTCEYYDIGKRLREFPLYGYAAHEWGHHAQNLSPLPKGLISFLMGSQANLEAAFQVVWYGHPISRISPSFVSPSTSISSLHLAAYFGLKEALTTILAQSTTEIDINVRDGARFTPLFYAAMGGNAEFIAWLLSIDEVDVNLKAGYCDYTPIYIAAVTGKMPGILPFIESDKADLNIKDWSGVTPLAKAAREGHVEVVKALIESGRVDNNSQDSIDIAPPSDAANGAFEVVTSLPETGKVNANEVDGRGRTPLHHALYSKDEEIARILLDSGQVDTSLSMEDYMEKLPLALALRTFGQDHSITELILNRMEGMGIDREVALQEAINNLHLDDWARSEPSAQSDSDY